MKKIPYRKKRLFCFILTVLCTVFVIAFKAMDFAINLRTLLTVVGVVSSIRWWYLALSCRR